VVPALRAVLRALRRVLRAVAVAPALVRWADDRVVEALRLAALRLRVAAARFAAACR
jgi:hypothetical protein